MSNRKIIKFTVSMQQLSAIRLDKIIVSQVNEISRSMVKKLILSGYVSINKKTIRIPKKKFF
ncbi:S4 domain-containing protein [Buchnera aphidicola]|uniref:S4 domain-containing protein n=1 Tax=Buchnera aphidicola TaxID=9 RepID=UPI0009E432FC|nr:S4 domain-containing protein [Buchnera aphidicola]